MNLKLNLKDTFKSKINITLLALMLLGLGLTIATMFFPALFVDGSITSMNIQYVTRIEYEWRYEYQQQCGWQYQWFLGQYQAQWVCTWVPVSHMVPVMKTVPQYFYYTTYFTDNVYLYDMIISSFSLGIKQLYFVIPILVILFSGLCLIFSNKSLFKRIGNICLGFLTIIFTGSFFGVLRLFLTNTSSSTLGASFYLLTINTIVFVAMTILTFINKTKDIVEDNKSLIIKNNHNYSLLVRFIIFIVLIVISEICVATIYGFILYLLFLCGLILSYSDKLWSKILMLVGASGIFIYSIVTMVLVLVDLESMSHFFDALPVDRLIMHVLNLIILIVVTILFIKEIKKIKNVQHEDHIYNLD